MHRRALRPVWLVFLLTATVVLYACIPGRVDRPRVVVSRYLGYLVERNYERAYPLLASSFRKKYQVKDVMSVSERLRGEGVFFSRPEVRSERIDGDRAFVRYSIAVRGGAGHSGRTYSGESELRREADVWRIVKIVALPRTWLESTE